MASIGTKYSVDGTHAIRPVERVWQEPAPVTLEEQQRSFIENGFCILKATINAEEVAVLREEYERLVRDHRAVIEQFEYALSTSHDGYDREPEDPSVFRKIGRPCLISQPYQALLCNKRILNFMRLLLKSDQVCLFRDVIYPKAARVARQKPWHHDHAYWPWKPDGGIIQAMTAIDRHHVDNACLQVVPGSHARSWKHETSGETRVELDADTLSHAVSIVLDPGDTLVFSSMLLHASPRNTSADHRCVVYIAYCAADLEYVGEGQPNSCVPILIPSGLSAFGCQPR